MKIKEVLKKAVGVVRRLHADEGGAEGLEKLLIMAAVVLPLLGLLIWFRNEIGEWVTGIWGDIRNEGDTTTW